MEVQRLIDSLEAEIDEEWQARKAAADAAGMRRIRRRPNPNPSYASSASEAHFFMLDSTNTKHMYVYQVGT